MTNININSLQKEIDELLNYLGNIGKYQWKIYLLSILPIFLAGMLSTSFVFTTSIPEYRCYIPECDNDTTIIKTKDELFADSFIRFTIPKKSLNKYENCYRFDYYYNINNSTDKCMENLFNYNTIKLCDNNQYKFNNEYFYSTIVTDYKLYCNNEWIVQLMQSLFFFGVLIGAIVNGIIADKFGRKIIFIIYSPVTTICILICLLPTNLSFYALGLFIKGICVAGIYQSAFTIGIECLGDKWRFWLGNSYSVIFATGAIYACFCAWYLRRWQLMELSNLIPALFMLPYPLILTESIRWQFSSGKLHKAIKQLKIAAKQNNVQIPNDLIDKLLNKPITVIDNKNDNNDDDNDVSIKDLFKHKLIRKWTITFLYIWFTNALVYYGLSFLAQDINPNIYLSMVLLMIVEFPGVLLVSYLGEFSRKYMLIIIMIFGGCCCIISSFLSTGQQLKMWLIIMGKMSISGSFSLIYVYTAEIFPTILRITGLGMSSFCSRFGAMIAPYLLRLHLFGDSFPFLLIGIITLIAGLAAIILPETKGKKLPDTLEEVEQLKYSNKQLQQILRKNQNQIVVDNDDQLSPNETDDLLIK